MALPVQLETATSPNGTRARSTVIREITPGGSILSPDQANKQIKTKPDGPTGGSWDSVFKFIATICTPVLGYSTLISGIGAFVYNGLMQKNSKAVDFLTNVISKSSLLSSGVFGVMHNTNEKNLPAMLGYTLDVLNPFFLSSKHQYLGRGIATSLDQMPAMIEDVKYKYVHEINERYNRSDKTYDSSKFDKFEGLWDSVDKTLFSAKVIFQRAIKELTETFKEEGLAAAIKDSFNKSRADLHLLISAVGTTLGSAIGGFGILKGSKLLENAGKFIRDIEGWHADYGVYLKKYSVNPETGQQTGAGNSTYGLAGLIYGGAGLADLAEIPFSKYGFHYLANGLDRFGGYKMIDAQAKSYMKSQEEKKNSSHP